MDPNNFKAFYQKAQAWKTKNEFDKSADCFKQAIRLAPQDRNLRQEYKEMIECKNVKVKEWNSKIFGFFDKA